jgi:hypothetical protein
LLIVVGTVGGVVKHDDPIRSEAKLAEHLRTEDPAGVCVQVFENGHRERARRAILAQLDADRSGMLLEDQERQARIARAADFDPPDGMVHGREEIRAADRSEILANSRFECKGHPIHCPEYPWYDWTFAKTHTQIACDPAVWSGVEGLIRQQIAPASAKQD